MVVPKLQHKYDFRVGRYRKDEQDVLNNTKYPLSPTVRADIANLLSNLEDNCNASRDTIKAVDSLYYLTRTGSMAIISGNLEVARKDIVPKIIDKYFHSYDIQYIHRNTTDIKVKTKGVVNKIDFTPLVNWEKEDYTPTVYIIDIDSLFFDWVQLEYKANRLDIVIILSNKLENSFIEDFNAVSIVCTQGDLYKHKWEVLRNRVEQAKEQSIELNQEEGVKLLSLLEGIMLMLDDEYK